MKTHLFLGVTLTALLVTGAASATKKTFTATLNGANERPDPVTTDGTGTAVFTVDDAAKTICGTVTYANLSAPPNAMHIHDGDANTPSGAVVQAIDTGVSPLKVNLTAVATAKLSKILSSPTYFNVHTEAAPGGEIRGQLTEGGDEQTCETTPTPDGGTNAGSDDGGTTTTNPGGSSTGNTSGNGAGTDRADSESSTPSKSTSGDDGGCSTSGTAPGSGLALAAGVGLVLSALRRRKR
jgi:MYXO-CTERM domain-containing protein